MTSATASCTLDDVEGAAEAMATVLTTARVQLPAVGGGSTGSVGDTAQDMLVALGGTADEYSCSGVEEPGATLQEDAVQPTDVAPPPPLSTGAHEAAPVEMASSAASAGSGEMELPMSAPNPTPYSQE